MWMRITFVLIALLVWDLATTDDGSSALERGGRALMSIEPVRDFFAYVENGNLFDDIKSLTTAASADAAAVVAVSATAGKERAGRREARLSELRLSKEDVDAIAKAVNELYEAEAAKRSEAAKAETDEENIDDAAAPVAMEAMPEPEAIEQSVASLGPDLLSAIVDASKKTGANSGYLLHIALRESGLVLGAQAPTSSATGPFQFIQQTWFQMLGTYGVKHGLKAEVALLRKQGSKYEPVSVAARREVLSLRTDPHVAALMAGELTMENAKAMTRLLGRAPAHGELYAAHVFGPAGAAKLVQTRDAAAATSAASILPVAAASNRWLFYTSGGAPRSVGALFDELSRFMSTREVAQVCNANLNFFGT